MSRNESLAKLDDIAKKIRYHALLTSSNAGSGHPTSALSAADLVTGLCFGGTFRYDLDDPDHPNNDRLIFSKGHASPLFYALWAAAGRLDEEDLRTYRRFGSTLEGHPTPRFRYADAATGSLGQGLSIGVGMALNARFLDKLPYRTWVLLGDSEMTEGSQWEAMAYAAHRGLDNLIGILDVNRLGQCGPTMYGHDLGVYAERAKSFGWRPLTIDGHDMREIVAACEAAARGDGHPTLIIARTIKGKGVDFLEDQEGWHGKALPPEDLRRALAGLGRVDFNLRGRIEPPENRRPHAVAAAAASEVRYARGDAVATRQAYGKALNRIAPAFPALVCLDGEVSNSTKAELFRDEHPDRFFEMYVAEQNMVGVALGLERRGKQPFVSTFAAFLTRAFDQIRMSQYSDAQIKFVGSHAGVAIGEDGPSQMGLEDLAMFRALLDGAVLYPCDAVATTKLVEEAARYAGITYLRTTRGKTPVLYDNDETFVLGGSKVLRSGDEDAATVVAAGVTLHEALAAYETLRERGILVRVIDLYSVRPVDRRTLEQAARETGLVLTVEDHGPAGGIADAVREVLAATGTPVHSLAVRNKPVSGKPDELLAHAHIDRTAIVETVSRLALTLDPALREGSRP